MTTDSNGNKVAEATRRITQVASERIGKIAYEIALLTADPKLTIVHKSNVLAVTDGLFRETVRAAQGLDERFKAVKLEEQIVDSCVYKWVVHALPEGYLTQLTHLCFVLRRPDSSAIQKPSTSSSRPISTETSSRTAPPHLSDRWASSPP